LEHPWFGWYSGKYQDFAKPSKVAVVSEYGAQALPNIDSLRKILPNKYLVPNGDKAKKEWEYHNFQFDRNKAYGIEFKSDLKTFIKDSQTYQADLIKFATEMLRIQKYHHTTGIFQFMFNEGWPSMNWGIVDYYRHIKPGYTALKEAYAPIIVVAKQMDDNTIELYVVNDTLEDISNAKLIVNITQKHQEKELGTPVSIKADSVRRIGSILLNEDASLFELRLEVNNKVVTKNKYNFERRETTP
jgi:beta-mannosidase